MMYLRVGDSWPPLHIQHIILQTGPTCEDGDPPARLQEPTCRLPSHVIVQDGPPAAMQTFPRLKLEHLSKLHPPFLTILRHKQLPKHKQPLPRKSG